MNSMTRVIRADLDRFTKAFTEADAIRTEADGFQWIDESRVPASLVRAYRLCIEHACVNGVGLSFQASS